MLRCGLHQALYLYRPGARINELFSPNLFLSLLIFLVLVVCVLENHFLFGENLILTFIIQFFPINWWLQKKYCAYFDIVFCAAKSSNHYGYTEEGEEEIKRKSELARKKERIGLKNVNVSFLRIKKKENTLHSKIVNE